MMRDRNQIDLAPHEWESAQKPKEPPPRYPRKIWFGLTDYGPPQITWQFVLTLFIAKVIVIAALNW